MPHLPLEQLGLPGRNDGCQPSNSPACLQGNDAKNTEETVVAQHEKNRGLSNALSLRAKYGFSDRSPQNCALSHKGRARNRDLHTERLQNYTKIMLLHQQDNQMKQTSSMNMSQAKYKYPVSDSHHVSDSEDDIHPEHDTDHELKSHREASHAKWTNESRKTILASAMQAARANSADLRALHSTILNGHISLAADVWKNMEQQWRPMPANNHLGQHRSGAKQKKHSHNHYSDTLGPKIKEELHSKHSSKSSTSSTADCLISPLHEYPLFIPNSQEDMLLCPAMDDVDSSNRCSSVDLYEAAMREERLQYIFDHENKRNFSHSMIDHPYAWKNGISCLHESLNLPPRSASMDIRTQGIDGDELQHMSLNLPRGSQQHLFKASMQNPLFDSQETLQSKQQKSSCNIYDESACSLPFNKCNVNMEYTSPRNILTDHKDDHHQETPFHNLMTRQQESMEFLCEEPANTRALNGQTVLAASEMHLSTSEKRNIQQDMVPASPMKKTDNHVTLSWNADQKHDRNQHNHHTYQSLHNPGLAHHQRLPHTLSNVPLQQSSSNVSGHKCSPALSGALPHTVSTNGCSHTDSTEIRAIDSSTSNAVGNDYSQLKKHNAIKGWFFRSKKKQHSTADHLHSPAAPACTDSRIAGKSHGFDITNAGKVSKSKQKFSIATDTVPKSAPKSGVFSRLATSDPEKGLNAAMAIDLMELKVLRANSNRDAAMAEVLELRLAIDSIGKKLQKVESHCEKLQSQLLERTRAPSTRPEDEAQMHPPASAGDELAAVDDSGGWRASDREEYDFCELDSHGHREERRAASSMVRSGQQVQKLGKLGYGGEIRKAEEQKKKEEFLGAVAEARVGVKQVSRVLLRHVQNTLEKGPVAEMAGDDEAELWQPIATMCRVAVSKADGDDGTKRRIKEVGFCVEALVGLAFYEHFENVGFDKSGAVHVLEPLQRAAAFHTAFLSSTRATPTQLLTQTSAMYDPTFEHFCSRKIKAVGRAVGCPGQMWPAELLRSFLAAARAVWLLHSLAFAYSDCAPAIFRVTAESPFDRRFMEQLLPNHNSRRRRHRHQPHQPTVSLMVVPGFFLRDDIIKCKVLSCYHRSLEV